MSSDRYVCDFVSHENLTFGSMRGGWRGGNSPDQSPTLLRLGLPSWTRTAGYGSWMGTDASTSRSVAQTTPLPASTARNIR